MLKWLKKSPNIHSSTQNHTHLPHMFSIYKPRAPFRILFSKRRSKRILTLSSFCRPSNTFSLHMSKWIHGIVDIFMFRIHLFFLRRMQNDSPSYPANRKDESRKSLSSVTSEGNIVLAWIQGDNGVEKNKSENSILFSWTYYTLNHAIANNNIFLFEWRLYHITEECSTGFDYFFFSCTLCIFRFSATTTRFNASSTLLTRSSLICSRGGMMLASIDLCNRNRLQVFAF